MNSLPAEADLLAVACPRCQSAIAVPPPLYGQPAACPLCTGGFMAPRPPSLQTLSPRTLSIPQTSPSPADQAVELALRPIDTSEPPPQTIHRAGESIELRRLTPEEKANRRARRTIVMIGVGTAILFTIVLLSARGGRKSKRARS